MAQLPPKLLALRQRVSSDARIGVISHLADHSSLGTSQVRTEITEQQTAAEDREGPPSRAVSSFLECAFHFLEVVSRSHIDVWQAAVSGQQFASADKSLLLSPSGSIQRTTCQIAAWRFLFLYITVDGRRTVLKCASPGFLQPILGCRIVNVSALDSTSRTLCWGISNLVVNCSKPHTPAKVLQA